MARGVTTEWEDIHVKLGNYLPREKEPTGEEIFKETIEKESKKDPNEGKTLEQVKIEREEKFDSDDEDEVLKEYQRKRMEELKKFAAKPKFGNLIEIRREDYIREVNNAPKDVYVVLFLYKLSDSDSRTLDEIFDQLARKYVTVKFMKIFGKDCITNIEDSKLPAVLIYYNGTMTNNYFPATVFFGGRGKISLKSKHFKNNFLEVEYFLSKVGIFKTDIADNPYANKQEEDDSEEEEEDRHKFKKGYAGGDDSDEDEKDDREYSWKIYRK